MIEGEYGHESVAMRSRPFLNKNILNIEIKFVPQLSIAPFVTL